MKLPEPVRAHLNTLYILSAFPAYLHIDVNGMLLDAGGYCERYGLDGLQIGESAADQVDFLIGMLPLNGSRFTLERLLIHEYHMADVHFLSDDSGEWIILLDVTEVAAKDAEVQQQANELRLLEERQKKLMRELEAGRDNLRAVLNQLKLTVAIIDSGGRVCFVSRSGLDLLHTDFSAVINRPWQEVFPFSPSDQQLFEKMLQNPGSRRERIRLSRAAPGKGISRPSQVFEVEVCVDPRDSANRMVYFYDISELVDLQEMLKNRGRFQGMVGQSREMRKVFQRIKDVARFDATVLIDGETGTGKELAARAVHFSSARKDGPFVVVNCAGLADSLINSQLFGHKKGSFTGAVNDRKGVFEAADGGTIVLDEIGDIPMNTQTRILRALEQREIIRVGETQARKVNIRILAATNKNLEEEVAKGNFRLDLLYRIKVARISLPPLRERREDIPPLVEFFSKEICLANGIELPQIEQDALRAMLAYDWPGNVRELRNAVEYALIGCKDATVRLCDLPPEITAISLSRSRNGDINHTDEKHRITAALEACDGRRDRAAQMLGISRATLYRKLKDHGIT